MSLSLVSELWSMLKPSIESGDTDHAAEILVGYLVEEGNFPIDIKQAFRGDYHIKNALEFYMESSEDSLYHSEEDDMDDDDDEDLWNNEREEDEY
jgi:hypothetical protein